MKDILRLSDLTIGYGKTTNRRVVMQGIEAALHPGRLTCLIGDNGVGKSTLLRTISAARTRDSSDASAMTTGA